MLTFDHFTYKKLHVGILFHKTEKKTISEIDKTLENVEPINNEMVNIY